MAQTKATVPLKGGEQGDKHAGWTADSRAVLVSKVQDQKLQLFRIDITTGARSLVSTIESADRAGFVEFGDLVVAADGDHYAYSMTRQLSHLYLLKFPG
jgi:hypothetical protein